MSKLKNRIVASILTLSASGLIGIASHEGFRSEAYIPVKGDVPTIGFGSTSGVHMGDKISVQEGMNRLMRDTETAQRGIYRCVRVPLSQGEFDAFTSFSFNVGVANFCSSTLVKKLNAGDYEGACAELKRWTCGPDPTGKYAKMYPNNHCAKGKAPLPGLIARREQEYKTCMQR